MSSELASIEKHMNKRVRVKFQGGREVSGVLKGCDRLINLVLDDSIEHLRSPDDPDALTGETRNVGLVVARGTSVIFVSPEDGASEIPNPFA